MPFSLKKKKSVPKKKEKKLFRFVFNPNSIPLNIISIKKYFRKTITGNTNLIKKIKVNTTQFSKHTRQSELTM